MLARPMMRRSLVLIALGLPVLGMSADARLDQTIAGFYIRIARDLLNRNLTTYTADFRANAAPNFQFRDAGYVDDLKQMIAQFRSDISFVPNVDSTEEKVIKVTVLSPGDRAVVTVDHKLTGSAIGRDHKKHDLVIAGRSQDMWRQFGGTWKLSSSTWISHLYMKDGEEPRSGGRLPGPGRSRFP